MESQSEILGSIPRQLHPVRSLKVVSSRSPHNPEIGKMVDQLLLQILSTPTGQRLCREYAGQAKIPAINTAPVLDFQVAFGLSAAAAEQAYQICQVSGREIVTQKRKPRTYILALLDPIENKKFDSWTFGTSEGWGPRAGDLSTLINLKKEDLSPLYLFSAMAHEFAMTIDSREDSFSRFEAHHEIFVEDSDQETTAREVAGDPVVRMVMSEIRAFRIENQILRELGFQVGDEKWRLKNCLAQVTELLPLITPMAQWAQLYKIANLAKIGSAESRMSLEAILSHLQSIRFQAGDGKIRNLCETLARPQASWWGFRRADADPGPRPPIGNGGGLELGKKDGNLEKLKAQGRFATEPDSDLLQRRRLQLQTAESEPKSRLRLDQRRRESIFMSDTRPGLSEPKKTIDRD